MDIHGCSSKRRSEIGDYEDKENCNERLHFQSVVSGIGGKNVPTRWIEIGEI